MKLKALAAVLIAGGIVSPLAHATNGYFPIGYGVKNEGMGGVGIALPQDAIAAAVNPAGMAMLGDRVDFALTWFRPNRDATITGNGLGMNGNWDGNGRRNFFIPDFGYNKMVRSDMSLGVSVYGNGGMNTQYDRNPFGGVGRAGVDLQQLFIAPAWSMKVTPTQSIGIALNLAYQSFAATGLQSFAAMGLSSNAAALTNNGNDTSTGVGLRLGWTGEITPSVTLGATYQTKTTMSKFSKYAGLFADQGSFDIPANYGLGIALKAAPQTTVGFDVVRILYSGVSSIGNSPTIPQQFGSSGGPGFGWQDMTVYKLGFAYAYDPSLTLRAGFNHNTQQIGANAAFINILAPGVVQNHLTLGATWTLANKSQVSIAYIHAFAQTVTGPIPAGNPPAGFGGGTASIRMYEDSIGVSYGW